LVAGTQFLERFLIMEALSDIGGLLLYGNKYIASVVVESFFGMVIANILNDAANDFLVV
jgi:hypothetical protein